MRRVLFTALLLSLYFNISHGQQKSLPDIGELMSSSRDSRYIINHCSLSYDKDRRLFQCERSIDVTLSQGRETIISFTGVQEINRVECGCYTDKCNNGGMVLGYMKVKKISRDTISITHAYAIGNEVIQCVIW